MIRLPDRERPRSTHFSLHLYSYSSLFTISSLFSSLSVFSVVSTSPLLYLVLIYSRFNGLTTPQGK